MSGTTSGTINGLSLPIMPVAAGDVLFVDRGGLWTAVGGLGTAGQMPSSAFEVAGAAATAAAAVALASLPRTGGAMSGLLALSVAEGLTAGAVPALAAPITAQTSVFTTVPLGGCVILAPTIGVPQKIFNRGAAQLNVLPPSPAVAIEGNAPGALVAIAAGGYETFTVTSATQARAG